jgi:hypothetical protein
MTILGGRTETKGGSKTITTEEPNAVLYRGGELVIGDGLRNLPRLLKGTLSHPTC